jgi:hypothetical protein
MVRRERDPEDGAGSARWQRRQARREAAAERMPKHGRAYVSLVDELLARRAAEAAGGGQADAASAGASRRVRRPSRARRTRG